MADRNVSSGKYCQICKEWIEDEESAEKHDQEEKHKAMLQQKIKEIAELQLAADLSGMCAATDPSVSRDEEVNTESMTEERSAMKRGLSGASAMNGGSDLKISKGDVVCTESTKTNALALPENLAVGYMPETQVQFVEIQWVRAKNTEGPGHYYWNLFDNSTRWDTPNHFYTEKEYEKKCAEFEKKCVEIEKKRKNDYYETDEVRVAQSAESVEKSEEITAIANMVRGFEQFNKNSKKVEEEAVILDKLKKVMGVRSETEKEIRCRLSEKGRLEQIRLELELEEQKLKAVREFKWKIDNNSTSSAISSDYIYQGHQPQQQQLHVNHHQQQRGHNNSYSLGSGASTNGYEVQTVATGYQAYEEYSENNGSQNFSSQSIVQTNALTHVNEMSPEKYAKELTDNRQPGDRFCCPVCGTCCKKDFKGHLARHPPITSQQIEYYFEKCKIPRNLQI